MFRIVLRRNQCSMNYSLWIMKTEGGKHYVAKPIALEFEEHGETWEFPESTLIIEHEEFHSLLRQGAEELANAGIRSHTLTMEGELKATAQHNESLRSIIHKVLDIESLKAAKEGQE